MSEVRYKAPPTSRRKIREFAQRLRKILGLENQAYVDIVALMECVFPIIFGDDHFSIEVIEKEKMGLNHGLTDPKRGKIYIREDVYEGACRGVGRDRLTMAHELGHVLLHKDVVTGLARVGDGEKVPTYCDPEWQASAFAGEFLMGHEVIQSMTVQEVAQRCGVSHQAAEVQKNK